MNQAEREVLAMIAVHARFQAAVSLGAWDLAVRIADRDKEGYIWPGIKEYARKMLEETAK